MGPDPTRAYFWPAVNKRPTRLRPGYFPIRPEDIFLIRKQKNWKIWCIRGNFPNSNPNHNLLIWPDPTWVKNFWPGTITTTEHNGSCTDKCKPFTSFISDQTFPSIKGCCFDNIQLKKWGKSSLGFGFCSQKVPIILLDDREALIYNSFQLMKSMLPMQHQRFHHFISITESY